MEHVQEQWESLADGERVDDIVENDLGRDSCLLG